MDSARVTKLLQNELLTIENAIKSDSVNHSTVQAAKNIIELVESRAGASGEQVQSLIRIVAAYCHLLANDEPVFVAENPRQKLRKLMLETISRLPTQESVIKRNEREISSMCFQLIKKDNEDNASIALKILIDLYKNCRPPISSDVRDFLITVRMMYQSLPGSMEHFFENPPKYVPGQTPDETKIGFLTKMTYRVNAHNQIVNSGGTLTTRTYIPKALNSLVVLIEAPIAVVLMYQLYRERLDDLFQLISAVLALSPSPQAIARPDFRRELYVNLIGVQIKSLSLVAYFVKLFPQNIMPYSRDLLLGLLRTLKSCPSEKAAYRKELIIAVRHISNTELKQAFIPHLKELFDDQILFGQGLTVREHIRPLGYHVIAELVHQLRTMLPYEIISAAVFTYMTNLHDDTLQLGAHVFSAKLVVTLIDCIRQSKDPSLTQKEARKLLMKIMNVFTDRLVSMANYDLICIRKSKPPKDEEERRQMEATFQENKQLLKLLVCGAKMVTIYLYSHRINEMNIHSRLPDFGPSERQLYNKFGVNVLKSVDIYTLSSVGKSDKDLKDTLEYFANTFLNLPLPAFKIVSSDIMEFLIDRMHENPLLHHVAHPILTRQHYSFEFSSILVKHAIAKMPEMGNPGKRSGLYLLLFKQLFGTVIHLRGENEEMLRPHLEQIVSGALKHAVHAKDPQNFFMLLRSLFRSISGGVHEKLYQEFLPILPKLLRAMNHLQAELHWPDMHDLFIELCLTVPVRLSYLLPLMNELMEPLVEALKGGPTLISQGLRTLELFVDNLQPDFLQEKIRPVRPQMMRALWDIINRDDIIRSSKERENCCTAAFRILGKFGGENRSSLREAPQLEWVDFNKAFSQIMVMEFSDVKMEIPLEKLAESALELLGSKESNDFTRRSCVQLLVLILTSFIEKEQREITDQVKYNLFFTKANDLFRQKETAKLFKCGKNMDIPENLIRKTIQGLIYSLQFEDSSISDVARFHIETLIRHLVIADCGFYVSPMSELPLMNDQNSKMVYIVEAIVNTFELQECNIDVISSAVFSLVKVAYETATLLLENGVKVTKLPFFVVIARELQQVCYERSWYIKSAARNVIEKLLEYFPLTWVYEHSLPFYKALLYILRDLENEVSFSTVELTHATLWKLIQRVFLDDSKNINPQDTNLARESLLKAMVADIISPFKIVRDFSQKTLQRIAKEAGKDTSEIILQIVGKYETILEIPPFQLPSKGKLGNMNYKAIPIQIGILNGSAFCLGLDPPVFAYSPEPTAECHTFLVETFKIMSADENYINRDCYKKWMIKNEHGYENSLTPLRIEAMRVMSHCCNIKKLREDIFSALYQNMTQLKEKKKDEELMKSAEACLEFFLEKTMAKKETEITMDFIHSELKPILEKITPRSCPRFEDMDCYVIERLAVLSRLLPKTLKLYDRFATHFRETLKRIVETVHQSRSHTDLLKMAVATAEVFPLGQISENSAANLEALMQLIIDTEEELGFYLEEVHAHLAMFFCKVIKFDSQKAYENLLSMEKLAHPGWTRLIGQFLAFDKERVLHEALIFTTSNIIDKTLQHGKIDRLDKSSIILYHVIQLIEKISQSIKLSDEKLQPLIKKLVNVWNTTWLNNKIQNTCPTEDYREIVLIADIFLRAVKECHRDTIILFELQKVFQIRNMCQFSEVKFWLKNEMPRSFSAEDRHFVLRQIFENWNKNDFSERVKADIMENIAIPLLVQSRDDKSLERVLGQPGRYDLVGIAVAQVVEWNPDASDHVKVSVLHLLQFLVQNCYSYIQDSNDPTERFRISRITEYSSPCIASDATSMEPFTKFNGHLLLAMIAKNFNVDRAVVLDLYERLLRAFGMHSKILVDQALDILIGKLSKDGRMDDVAAVTRRILVEEFQILRASAQLSHVVGLIERHSDTFFECKDKSGLVGVMVPNMSRLSSSNFSEQRCLAVKLGAMLINWQKRSLESPNPVSIVEKKHAETIISFLIRIMNQYFSTVEQSGASAEIINKCKGVFKTIYENNLWENIPLRLQVIEKCFESIDGSEQKSSEAVSAMMTLKELVHIVPNSINEVLAMQDTLINLICKADLRIYAGLKNLLKEIVSKYGSHPNLQPMRETISHQLNEGFSQCENSADPIPEMRRYLILVDSCKELPGLVEDVSYNLVRLFHRVSKEHLSTNVMSPQNPRNDERQSGLIQGQILTIFEILQGRLSSINTEARKTFLSQQSVTSVIQLIERSDSIALIEAIVESTASWVKSGILTAKERGLILPKLFVNLSRRLEDLFDEKKIEKERLIKVQARYLDIIFNVYYDERGTDGTGNQGDLIPKLEGAYLWGMSHSDRTMRMKFFDLYSEWVPNDITQAVLFIFSTQIWDQLSTNFLPIALALLLRRVNKQKPSLLRRIPIFQSLATLFESGKLLNDYDEDGIGPDRHRELFSRLTSSNNEISENFNAENLLGCLSELGFASPKLARYVWKFVFPSIWKAIPTKQHQIVGKHLRQFMLLSHPSHRTDDIVAFVESIVSLSPPVDLKPYHLRYLSETYPLQPLAAVTLEETIAREQSQGKRDVVDLEQPPGQNAAVVLAQIYDHLGEATWKTSVWESRCQFAETSKALHFMEQAKYDDAQTLLEKLIHSEKQKQNLSPKDYSEYDLWRESWITCCKELNSWESLYSHAAHQKDTVLAAECCWKLPNTWNIMKDAVVTLEQSSKSHQTWRVHLYKGYLSIRKCIEDVNKEVDFDVAVVDKHSRMSVLEAIRAWRKLPKIVSSAHAPLLRAAHQIVELNEAATIHECLGGSLIGTEKGKESIKDIVKRWKNRLPLISDPLSHWSDIVTWHHHQYQSIVTQYEQIGTDQSNVGMHASATDFIYYARIARIHGQLTSALESLQQINQIPSVSVFDCYIRTIEQIKCYLTMNNQDDRHLKVIQETSLRFFKPPEQSEILALKAKLQGKVKSPPQDPSLTFCQAVQVHDSVQAWGHWAEWLVAENLEKAVASNKDCAPHAATALTALLQASRQQASGTFMPNVIYCLTWDFTEPVLEVLDQIADSVPAIQWLPWIPQLINSLCRPCGHSELAQRREDRLRTILYKIAKKYPLAVYLPIRTKYLSVKMENKQKNINVDSATGCCCSRLMYLLRDEFPPLLASTEAMIETIKGIRETWAESLIRQMRGLLKCCLHIQYSNTNSVNAAKEPAYLDFIKSLRHSVADFRKNVQGEVADEQSMKKFLEEYPRDLGLQAVLEDESKINISEMANLIPQCSTKLRKWIRKLENVIKNGKKYFYLSNWRYIDGEIEVPGQSLEPKEPKTFIRVSKIISKGVILDQFDAIVKQISFLGKNGRIYKFLCFVDDQFPPQHASEPRREERSSQLKRAINPILSTSRLTSRRGLTIESLKIIPLGPLQKLVEHKEDGETLWQIYQKSCIKKQDRDSPLSSYFSRISSPQKENAPSDSLLKETFSNITHSYVPKDIFFNWAKSTFPSHVDFLAFKGRFLLSIAVQSVVSYCYNLNAVAPSRWLIDRKTGSLFIIGQKIESSSPKSIRLTPNLMSILTFCGSPHALVEAIQSTCQSMLADSFVTNGVSKAIIRDEELIADTNAWGIATQTKANAVALNLEKLNKDATKIVLQASNPAMLARADPSFYPWL
ncbi:Oidioi.mRNA.OKI2018_I69.chr1.g3420.t1.cds [Oikopleura dioica]|uniref:Oidioi.mRNA.OKI2018_I69.chr1.g3420.t1.cds n=1 Tax=Oikopleura dioica TaxID=34765 RepID=A0ABN7SUN6_OIKDI|nr:Oidioi.mRNA.OKI2018_I69.chr1.g3420.t1.cds [Oikopleura dioica]